jgi:hypothetical protein
VHAADRRDDRIDVVDKRPGDHGDILTTPSFGRLVPPQPRRR